MRLLITFEPIDDAEYSEINKYDLQGFIYSLLREDENYKNLHNVQGFKFFNFSNIFPISKFERNNLKKLIVSSPDKFLINALYSSLKNKNTFRLNKYKMELLKVKILRNNDCFNFISATPIVLFKDNKINRYYSFKQNPDFNFFLNRVKDNSIKKYNAFYDDEFELNGNLFSSFEFVREVSIRIKKNGNSFIVIGSLWRDLEVNLTKDNKKFYKFLFDTGLGEKNSLGFGFLNCKR
ncbi:MAG: CRISPR-associated endoribonuclease Cas6 [Methanobrevibacter sp.]|uniref:CRISPR-associated endoribonuclease Cas6 n=1 Tax=Methanobrevibacter sp. TaxID=66852 RepID=UPI003F033617